MPAKTKMLDDLQDRLTTGVQILGFGLMATAAVVGTVDLPSDDKKVIIPRDNHNQLRREREETAPHFISYSEIQRTPGRAGKY